MALPALDSTHDPEMPPTLCYGSGMYGERYRYSFQVESLAFVGYGDLFNFELGLLVSKFKVVNQFIVMFLKNPLQVI